MKPTPNGPKQWQPLQTNEQKYCVLIALMVLQTLSLVFSLCIRAEEIGGGGTYYSQVSGNLLTISNGNNSYYGGISAISYENYGGSLIIYKGTNTFGNTVSALGGNPQSDTSTTYTVTGGSISIVNGKNTFSGAVSSSGGAGPTANGSLSISGGTNTFASTVSVTGSSYYSNNNNPGTMTISGGTNVFNGAVIVEPGLNSQSGGIISITGGTLTFTSTVTAENGTGTTAAANGTISISGTTSSGVTLQGFQLSNFQTAPTYYGKINLLGMTINENISSTGQITIGTYTDNNSSVINTSVVNPGVTVSSASGPVVFNGGTLNGTLSGTNVYLYGGTSSSTASVTATAAKGVIELGGMLVPASTTLNLTAAAVQMKTGTEGTLNVTGSINVSTLSNNSTFGAINITSGSFSVSAGTNTFTNAISSPTNIIVQGGVNTFSTAMTAVNTMSVIGGTNTFSEPLTASAGNFTIGGGTNTFGTTINSSNGNVFITGGMNTFEDSITASPTAQYTVNGRTYTGGVFIGSTAQSTADGYSPAGPVNTFKNITISQPVVFGGNSSFSGELTASSSLSVDGNITFIIPASAATTPLTMITTPGTISVDGGSVTVDVSALPTGTVADVVLIQGNASARTDLSALDGQYSSLMYQYSYAADTSGALLLSVSAINDTGTVAAMLGGNAPAANALLQSGATAVFDVPEANLAIANSDAAAGAIYPDSAEAHLQRMTFVHQSLGGRIADCAGSTGMSSMNWSSCDFNQETTAFDAIQTHLWFMGLGMGAEVETNSSLAGYGYTTGGFLIGAELPDNFVRLGAFYGLTMTNVSGFGSNYKSTDNMLGVYGLWNNEHIGGYSSLIADVSFNDQSTKRNFADTLYNSSSTANQVNLYYEKGWKLELYQRYMYNPWISFEYVSFHNNGFGESGGGAYNLDIDDFNVDSVRMTLGLRLKQRCKWGTFGQSISWNKRVGGSGSQCLATVNSGGNSYSGNSNGGSSNGASSNGGVPAESVVAGSAVVTGNTGGDSWAELTISAYTAIDDVISISGEYYLLVNDQMCINAGLGTITFRF